MSDIECPACGRIAFAHETQRNLCEECSWPIRVVSPTDGGAAYGYDVRIEIRTGAVGTAQETRHYKGTEATARRRAKMVPNYLRVLAVRPWSYAQWVNAYGEGNM
jgi:hypothetical protein